MKETRLRDGSEVWVVWVRARGVGTGLNAAGGDLIFCGRGLASGCEVSRIMYLNSRVGVERKNRQNLRKLPKLQCALWNLRRGPWYIRSCSKSPCRLHVCLPGRTKPLSTELVTGLSTGP